MSEHAIELPEAPESEEERTEELEEVSEVSHEVITLEASETLETESTQYAQESAVLDRRIESLERVQTLEAGSSTSSTPAPTRRGLQRANAVRSAAIRRGPTPSASYDARYVARARSAGEKLSELTTPQPADRLRIEKLLDLFGTSMDELLADMLNNADLSTDPSDKALIVSSLNQRGWSSDGMRENLRALAACAAPGQQADIVTAVEAAERLLVDLRSMSEAIGASNAPLTSIGGYLAIVSTLSAGVARTLEALAGGNGIRPWTKAQRCLDLAARLDKLGAGPLEQLQAQVDGQRLSKDRAEKQAATLSQDMATYQQDLQRLGDADDSLDEELPTADEARRAAIEAELEKNSTAEEFLRGKLDSARKDVAAAQARARQAGKDLAALQAQLRARSSAIHDSGLSFVDRTRSTNWGDAVSRARASLRDLDLPKPQRQALDAAVLALGPTVDAQFDALRLAIQDVSDPASVDNVLALGWEFARLLTSVRFHLAGLDVPKEAASAAEDLQVTLANLAGYLANLVSVRSGLTTT